VADTTALDGNDIDAVAASLIEGPEVQEDETAEEDLVQADEADADDQTDAEDAEADEVDADEDDSQDDSEEADEEPASRLHTVKVDGEAKQVTYDELIRGYAGQAYVQKGMQENAQARKQVEAVYSALQSQYQQVTQFAQAVQTGQVPLQPPQAPSEDLLQKDPIGYLEARVKYDKDLAQFQQSQQALQYMQAQQEEVNKRAHMANLADQHQQLVRAIPAFAKPETAAKLKQVMLEVGSSEYGFSPDELRAVTDSRVVRALHDAVQFRRLMAGKTVAERQAAQPKAPTIKPGAKVAAQASKKTQVEKVRAQMKRTGSVDDVARFLLM
jgi:hypothetical protein